MDDLGPKIPHQDGRRQPTLACCDTSRHTGNLVREMRSFGRNVYSNLEAMAPTPEVLPS